MRLMEQPDAAQRQVKIDVVNGITGRFEQRCQATGCDHPVLPLAFAIDASNQPLDQAYIAPEDTRLHGRNRVIADNLPRLVQRDSRQAGGGQIERFQGEIDPGGDHTTTIATVRIDYIEGGGRPEIQDDHRPGVGGVSRPGVGQAIRPYLLGARYADRNMRARQRLVDADGFTSKIMLTQLAQRPIRRRDHIRDGDRRNILRPQIDKAQQVDQPDPVLIAGSMWTAGAAPGSEFSLAVIDRKDTVGIAIVNHQQHGAAPSDRPRHWKYDAARPPPSPAEDSLRDRDHESGPSAPPAGAAPRAPLRALEHGGATRGGSIRIRPPPSG